MTGPILTAEQRAGLLVVVITGGRPLLKQRPTHRLLPALEAAGFGPALWVVSDRDAPDYQPAPHGALEVYPHAWAYDWARTHWMSSAPPTPTGFLGGFPGREWACQEAERRGCWGILQLDDNILPRLKFVRGTAVGSDLVDAHGGLGMFADILGALSLSTNARMLGAALDAVAVGARDAGTLIRPGFPYSCFVERVGEHREPWLGPFEEDITHAFQYGSRYDGATAALVPLLHYAKEHTSTTGMRVAYDSTRSVQLQRLIPQGAGLGVRATRANGRGEPRVFHTMRPGAIRNPVRVLDRELYELARTRVADLRARWYDLELERNRAKVVARAAKYPAVAGAAHRE